MTRPSRIALVLVGIVVVASCGSGEVAADDREQQLQQERQRIEALLPDASELQQDVLGDGFVTAGEADRVAAAVVACASQQGTVVTPIWTEGNMEFRTFGGQTEESSDRAIAVFESCYESEFSLVASSLGIQNALTTDQLEQRNQLVLDCLLSNGFDVGDWPAVELEPDPQVESQCVDDAYEQLGL